MRGDIAGWVEDAVLVCHEGTQAGTAPSILIWHGFKCPDEAFTDWSELSVFFHDHVFDLGDVASGQPLTLSFELAGDSHGFSARMVLAASTRYQAWAGLTGIQSWDPGLTDADNDGETDLMEFAFGTDPWNGSRGSHLPVEILADRVRIQFNRRRPDTQGLEYVMEVSAELSGQSAWAPMAAPWVVSLTPLNETMESVTCELPRHLAPPSLFIRMKIDLD